MDAATSHPFAHLGPAPYRVIGVQTTQDREAAASHARGQGLTYTTNMCGGSCDHCGTAIWDVYTIEAANGCRFKVGSTCVEKAAREAADKTLLTDHAKAARKAARGKRAAKADKVQAELTALLADESVRSVLAAIPSAEEWRAARGETLLTRCDWMAANAGATGRAATVKAIKAVLAALRGSAR